MNGLATSASYPAADTLAPLSPRLEQSVCDACSNLRCSPDDSRAHTGCECDRQPVRLHADGRLREGEPRPGRGRPADAGHGQPGLPAVVGRSGEEAVADLEPGERAG